MHEILLRFILRSACVILHLPGRLSREAVMPAAGVIVCVGYFARLFLFIQIQAAQDRGG